MWQSLAKFVLRYRVILLTALAATTVLMGYYAAQVKLSYEFSRAIPTDNPKYRDYLFFKEKFGEDGNLMVVGIQSEDLFQLKNFQAYRKLEQKIRQVEGVQDVTGMTSALNLVLNDSTAQLLPIPVFDSILTQASLDSAKGIFFALPFYQGLLHNPSTHAYLMGVHINKEVLTSRVRTRVIGDITKATDDFRQETGMEVRLSGLPLIRTVIADRIQQEMKIFLFGSLVLSVLTLLLFFRSWSTMLLSITVVVIGVVWSLGIIVLCGFKISLLTALIPSLIVVIGIPNCIYFINKYHVNLMQSGNKEPAIVDMVGKMGVVTLFCNITAAIGFAVFALTKVRF
jgi:predicted RND superfamily exporter protein